jgi:hypothetical protein
MRNKQESEVSSISYYDRMLPGNIQSSVMSNIYLLTKNYKTSQISTLTSNRKIMLWYLLPSTLTTKAHAKPDILI